MYMINILKRKIKYKKHILIIFMTLIYILSNPFSVYAKDKVNIYFFNGEGCSYCEEFKSWIDTIKPEYGNLFELKDYEIWYNKENASLMYKVAELRGEEVEGVPYIVIGNHSWIGFHESYTPEIMTTIESEYNKNLSERYDVMNLVNSNSNNQKVDSSGSNTNEETTIESSDDNGITAALFVIVGIVIIVMAIVIISKYKKLNKNDENTAKLNKKILWGISISVFVIGIVVLSIIVTESNDSSNDYLNGTDDSNSNYSNTTDSDDNAKKLYKYNIEDLDYSIFKTKFYEIHYHGGSGDSYFEGEGTYILKEDGTCFTTQKRSIGLYGADYTALNSTECFYEINDNRFSVNMKIHSITHYNGFDDSKDEEINVNGDFSDNYKYLQIGDLKFSSEHYNTYLEKNMEYVLIDPITTTDYTLDGISLGNSENSIDVSKYKIINK